MEKTGKLIITIIQCIFAAFGALLVLGMLLSNAIATGIIILLSAVIVSPLPGYLPFLKEKPLQRTILQFVLSFVMFIASFALYPMPENAVETINTEENIPIATTGETEYTTSFLKTTTTIAEATSAATTTTLATTEILTTTETSTTIETSTTLATTSTTVATTTTTTQIITTTKHTTTETKAVEMLQTEANTIHFILNTDTNCVHLKDTCRAAKSILPENYQTIDIAESDLSNYSGVYWACGICAKRYDSVLPKP